MFNRAVIGHLHGSGVATVDPAKERLMERTGLDSNSVNG
jgi:hypothetical protein